MRVDEFPDPDHYLTFEVTIPKDSEDIVTALRGLTTTFGLPVRQRPALSADLDNNSIAESWQIKEEHFIEVSRELWNSDIYGISVAAHLQGLHFGNRFPIWANGTVNVPIPKTLQNAEVGGAPFIPLWKNGQQQLNTGYNLTDQALLTRARILWDHYHLPYTLKTSFSDAPNWDRSTGRSIDLSSGDMTRERLADYARANNSDKHSLHGALGKMLDTMCVVAGVIEKNDIGERDVDTEFISADEFEQMLATSELNKRTSNDILKRIRSTVVEQLSSGRPYEHGEVIVEGGPIGWLYDRIATRSLAALARSYKSNKNAPGAQFLRQL